ncbi:MAG TPA: iron-containing alcohol dehydrogenase [Candidatus Thermoplasmatota archaeon]|nr:iron-containing alcohol dehydrogenase [Candidatus Thermoplasmatota archaeon]
MEPALPRFVMPATCRLGWGAAEGVGKDVRRVGASRALVVTTHGLEGSWIVKDALAALGGAGVETELSARAHGPPDDARARDVAEAFRSMGADALVSIGGGSAHDLAKAAGVLATHGGALSDHEGVDRLRVDTPVHVALNTTAGSGSELSRLLFVVDREKGRPAMIRDERITPRVAINDPGTHVTSPPEVTAAAGMNLLTHAIEAYFSRNAAPLTDALALDAVALVAEHLPRAVADGNDPKARGALAMAEQLAGIAYNSAGLGVADAIALSLTAQYDLPHGAINGALLPHVVALDVAERRSKARRLAETLGGSEPGRIPEALAEVARRAGAPLSLSALGLEEDVVYTSIGAILESPLLDLHPTVMTEERLVDIVVAAVSGAPPEVRASAR